MRQRPPLVALAAAVTGVLALPAVASACTCARDVPEAKRFAAADAAFVGVLESRRALDPPRADGITSTGDRFVHRYRVQRRYKGRLGGKVWVRTVRSTYTCGIPARRRVALYLDRENGTWQAASCSVTSEAALRAIVRGDRSVQTAAAVSACRSRA